MPRTIEEGFRDFVTKLTPSETETKAARGHRASIRACLRNNFGLRRYRRIGSFGNGTSVSGYSDVDYLACLPATVFTQNSAYALQKVRAALHARFPLTGVTVRTPAVVVPFAYYAAGQAEVVPANYLRREYDFHVYKIADGAGGWMRTSPDAHHAYVRDVDKKVERKVRPLIRIIKAWKYMCNVPISSFYLELRIAKYAEGERGIVYYMDVRNFLRQLLSRSLAGMQDPMGVSGIIDACATEAKREQALSKLQTAVSRAERAYAACEDGRIADAFDWLSLLFCYEFPSYYYG